MILLIGATYLLLPERISSQPHDLMYAESSGLRLSIAQVDAATDQLILRGKLIATEKYNWKLGEHGWIRIDYYDIDEGSFESSSIPFEIDFAFISGETKECDIVITMPFHNPGSPFEIRLRMGRLQTFWYRVEP